MLLSVAVSGVSVPAPDANAQTGGAATLVLLDSEPGDRVGEAQELYSPTDAAISVSGTGTRVDVEVRTPLRAPFSAQQAWSLTMLPPQGGRLLPGTYENATRPINRGPGQPGLEIFGHGRGCNQSTGRFVVHEADYELGTDRVRRFAATLQQRCTSHPGTLFSEVRFESTRPVPGLEARPFGELRFGLSRMGLAREARTITLHNIATQQLALGAAAILGTNASEFAASRGCDGRALAPGDGCVIEVTTSPAGLGERRAVLEITDGTARGRRRIELVAHGEEYLESGAIDTLAGWPGEGPSRDVPMSPAGLHLLAGSLYVADDAANAVWQVDLATGRAAVLLGNGVPGYTGNQAQPGRFTQTRGPVDVTTGVRGQVLVADRGNHRVRYMASGVVLSSFGDGTAEPTDGQDAFTARLRSPWGIARDAAGDVFLAEEAGHRIRKVDGLFTASTLAGDGQAGFSGDGGPASSARLSAPRGLAVGSDGSVYVADTGNHRVRRIDASGQITTVAGSGTRGFAGDGGAATAAQLDTPSGIALATDGALLVADTGNRRVRRVAGGQISTVAGGGSGGDGGPATAAVLDEPWDVEVGPDGTLYIAEHGAGLVRAVAPDGTIRTIAGSGPATPSGAAVRATGARLHAPASAASSADGEVFFAEPDQHRVRAVRTDGSVATVAGTGTKGFSGDGGAATEARFDAPSGVIVDGQGRLLVADTGNGRVRRIGQDGRIETIAGGGTSPADGQALQVLLHRPVALALDAAGRLLIAEQAGAAVRRLHEGRLQTVVGRAGEPATAAGQGDGSLGTQARLAGPTGVSVDAAGGILVADAAGDAVRRLDPCGFASTFAGTAGPAGATHQVALEAPHAAVADDRGQVIVSEPQAARVISISPAGGAGVVAAGASETYPNTVGRPVGLSPGRGGILLADAGHERIRLLRGAPAARPGTPSCTRGDFFIAGPNRILDTRTQGGPPVPRDSHLDVQVTGTAGVPETGVAAVALNVAATRGTQPTFLTVWPSGTTRPHASNVNAAAGQTASNLVVVPVPKGGRVSIYNCCGDTHVFADLLGWYGDGTQQGAGLRLHALNPQRTLDTREGTGAPARPVGPDTAIDVQIRGRSGVPQEAVAVALSVAATRGSAESFVTVWPAGTARPLASNVNVRAGETVANTALVRLGDEGKVSLYNCCGATDMFADVLGYFTSGPAGRLVPAGPARVADTRDAGPLGRDSSIDVQVAGVGEVPDLGATAVVLSVGGTGASADTFLTVWPTGSPRPFSSNLNLRPGDTRANTVLVPLGTDGKVSIYNCCGTTHVFVDVLGWVFAPP